MIRKVTAYGVNVDFIGFLFSELSITFISEYKDKWEY